MRKTLNRQTRAVMLGLMAVMLPAAASAQAPAPQPASNPTGPTDPSPGTTPPPSSSGTWGPSGFQPDPSPGAAPAGNPPAQPQAFGSPPPGQPVQSGSNYPAYTPYAKPKADPTFLMGSLNVGMGVPYGVMGGALSVGMDYLALMAGVGTTVFAGAGYGLGVRVYFMDTNPRNYVRPHFTAVWGTTAVYKISGAVDMKGTLRGFGFYAGLDQDVGESGGIFLSYGIGYITHEDLPASVISTLDRYGVSKPDLGLPIKLLFAAGYRFGGQ